MISVKKDIRSHKVLISILLIGFMPLFLNDYCRYLLALLIPYALINWKVTKNLVLITLFSIIYTSAFYIRGESLSPSALVYYLVYPLTLYLTGLAICQRFKNAQSNVCLMVLLAFALAFPAIYYNLLDFFHSGQLIRIGRDLTFGEDDSRRTATGYGMMMSLALGLTGIIFCICNNKTDRRLKLFTIIISLTALFCTVRLLNRTGLVIASVSCIAAVLSMGVSFKRVFYIILVFGVILIGYYFLSKETPLIADAVEYYIQRDSGVGSVEGFGGRDERWSAAISQIISRPLGDVGLDLGFEYNYAHNLWLDVGIRGGVLSLLILLIITYNFIRQGWRVYRQAAVSKFDRQIFLLLGIAFLLQLSTEPIIEGLPQFFWLWLFFLGMLDAFHRKLRKSIEEQ